MFFRIKHLLLPMNVVMKEEGMVIAQQGNGNHFVFGHDTQLTGADHFARVRKLGVGSVNVHVSQPILDFESFEVHRIRHVGTVCHPHAVRA